MAKKKPTKVFWAVMVGKPSLAYPLEGKLFEKRAEAVAHKRSWMPCAWSGSWRIAKLAEIKE